MNTDNNNIPTKEEYLNSMHRLGRIIAISSILIMLAMPIIAGLYFDAMPSFVQVIITAAPLLAVFFPVAISEVISFTPILGSSIYLTLVTGNVMNLKMPVATNAMRLTDVEYGSEDADVISSIAVSVSSLVTILIIALGVILMMPLQPLLTLPAVQTATQYVLPALFGCLALGTFGNNIGGGVKAPGRMKGAILPAIIVIAITLLDEYVLHIGIMSGAQGFVIILMLPIAYFGTKWLYNKGKIKVILPEDAEAAKKE